MTDKEFTPETFAVRNAYALTMKNAHITSEGEAKAEFDRWLASVKAEAKAEALRDAASRYVSEVVRAPGGPTPVGWLEALADEMTAPNA